MPLPLLVLGIAFILFPASMLAQHADSTRRVRAVHAATAPVIDGRLDDPAWRDSPIATGFVQRSPTVGAPASAATETRIAYDAQTLYVAVRLHDAHVDSIAAPLGRRDVPIEHSEWVYVMLDSYADRRSAFVFVLNPRGVQRDFAVFGDASEDASWDAVWDAAARVDSLGWSAEFAIPLSQLRFDPRNEAWGLNIGRYLARRQEMSFWSPWSPEASGYVSRFGVLDGLIGLAPVRRIELRPYALARVRRAPFTAGDPFRAPTEVAASAGTDLRVGLSSSFTLSATINPDFGQVDADPADVNLTEFETQLDERRPFFVEGTDIFSFGLGDSDNLFYSRRIGRAPQGRAPSSALYRDQPEASRILGAMKISGRTSQGLSAGLLGAVTSRESAAFARADGTRGAVAVEPLSAYTVARVIQTFRGGRSAIGAIATSTERRITDDAVRFLPHAGRVAGLDARHRFGGSSQYEVQAWAVGSRVAGSADAIERLQRRSGRYFQRPDADHVEVDTTRTALSGLAASTFVGRIGGRWRWGLQGAYRSPELETSDLGFLQSVDQVSESSYLQYRQSRPGRWFRSWDARVSQSVDWTTAGETVGSLVAVGSSFQLHNYWGGYIQPLRRNAVLSTSALRGGPALLVPGYTRLVGIFNTDRRRTVSGRLIVNGMVEDATGGWSQQLTPTVDMRLAPTADISLGVPARIQVNPWQYVTTTSVAGESRYIFARLRQTQLSIRARMNYAVSPALSLQIHAEPFASVGAYDAYAEVAAPRTSRFSERFSRFTPTQIAFDSASSRYAVDRDGDGVAELTFARPDFNSRHFRSNAVLRWEYQPGSTLFVVWQQQRQSRAALGAFDLQDEVSGLLGARPTNVLLVKLTHWLGM